MIFAFFILLLVVGIYLAINGKTPSARYAGHMTAWFAGVILVLMIISLSYVMFFLLNFGP